MIVQWKPIIEYDVPIRRVHDTYERLISLTIIHSYLFALAKILQLIRVGTPHNQSNWLVRVKIEKILKNVYLIKDS